MLETRSPRIQRVAPPPRLALAFAFAFAAAPLHAQGITREQAAAVDAVFEEWRDPAGPGAAVAVTRGGRVVYSQGYGSAQLEYRIPVTPVTVFHVASVSKQFTAFAVALLARDGLLSWDDDVRAHLPELPDLGHPLTLRQLASHTSGVRDQWQLLVMAGWRMDDVITRDQILRMMARQRELNFEPGTAYLYSNMGYTLLAEVVERVSGQGFGEFLEERVFRPLGMHRTHVHDDHTRIVPGRAYSYAPVRGGGWRNAVLSYANQGATSLFTTVEDLARWLAEYEEPVVGDAALWAEMRERAVLADGDTVPYALGLQLGEYGGLRTVGHGGADAGFRTNLVHFPEARLGVVVFGNASTFRAADVARRVAEVFLEERMAPRAEVASGPRAEDEPDDEPVTLAPEALRAYAGTYYSPELETYYRLRVDGERLVMEHPRHPPAALTPRGEDRFEGSAWQMRDFVFSRGADGAVDGFRVSGGRVLKLRFERVAWPVLER